MSLATELKWHEIVYHRTSLISRNDQRAYSRSGCPLETLRQRNVIYVCSREGWMAAYRGYEKRGREERKTNGTDWFPPSGSGTGNVDEVAAAKEGPRVCQRRQETLAHSLITQLKWTGNIPPVPCRLPPPLSSLLLHCHYDYYIAVAIVQLYQSDVTRGRSSVFKPRPFIDISCTQHRPMLSYWELVLIERALLSATSNKQYHSFTKHQYNRQCSFPDDVQFQRARIISGQSTRAALTALLMGIEP
ncbi:hypothetical protein DBV15_09373 [Temnothorax longispinosus]|uniref:Uncharacterized protein n=1 Tax=Temnothorax longispinosus TaxID=300112 RepID=A0A4S2KK43_9HYME|nr:hypothetical protein DBV15_09373 [Temnothorax longispinosus]